MRIKVTLLSGRTLAQGEGIEAGKTSREFFSAATVIELNKTDAERAGIKEGDPVRVRTAHGEVVVTCKVSDELPTGVAFIPYGPWMNRLVGTDTGGIGMPGYKGIEAEVEVARGERVLTIEELAKTLMGVV